MTGRNHAAAFRVGEFEGAEIEMLEGGTLIPDNFAVIMVEMSFIENSRCDVVHRNAQAGYLRKDEENAV